LAILNIGSIWGVNDMVSNNFNEEFLEEFQTTRSSILQEANELLERDAIDFEEWAFWHGFHSDGEV